MILSSCSSLTDPLNQMTIQMSGAQIKDGVAHTRQVVVESSAKKDVSRKPLTAMDVTSAGMAPCFIWASYEKIRFLCVKCTRTVSQPVWEIRGCVFVCVKDCMRRRPITTLSPTLCAPHDASARRLRRPGHARRAPQQAVDACDSRYILWLALAPESRKTCQSRMSCACFSECGSSAPANPIPSLPNSASQPRCSSRHSTRRPCGGPWTHRACRPRVQSCPSPSLWASARPISESAREENQRSQQPVPVDFGKTAATPVK